MENLYEKKIKKINNNNNNKIQTSSYTIKSNSSTFAPIKLNCNQYKTTIGIKIVKVALVVVKVVVKF